jgi:hypothetical protein
MKTRSAVLRYGTVLAAFVALASTARADDFIEACKSGNRGGSDMTQTCNCISGKLPAASRADATAALRRMTQSMADNAMALDPSSLPPNLMRGLQAYVLAQADCM